MPKKTVDKIRRSKNHYLVQVKGNQPSLYKDIGSKAKQPPLETYTEQDHSHGRKVTRTTRIYAVTNDQMKDMWTDLKTYILVERSRQTRTEISNETAYFISDLNWNAEQFHHLVRDHWKIENCLHWVKDVVHKEDKNNIRSANGPICAAVCSTIAINFHRKQQHHSITEGQILFRANVKELFNMIRT